jgi:DNA-binding transcriptional ArsR family regulator
LYFDNIRNSIDILSFDLHDGFMKLDDAAARLEALGNPIRLKIYRALVRAGDAGLPVGRLQDKLKIAPSTLSHHIKTLVTVGLVSQVREATTLVCHANYDLMRGLVDFLVAECCADAAECKDASVAA